MTTIQQAFAFSDHKTRSHPMTQYVEEEADIEGMFDMVSYQKGDFPISDDPGIVCNNIQLWNSS